MVNQEFSRKFLNGADPIGRQFRVLTGPGEPEEMYQIVGVVRNSKYASMREEFKPTAYLAIDQELKPDTSTNLVVRSGLPIGSVLTTLKEVIRGQNAETSVQFQVFNARIQESLLRERLMATLSGFFGLLAGILATVGLYGVISYMVTRRRNEIGIRIALGAARGNVIGLILREAGILVAAGLVAGTALAIAGARTAASLLYGLKPGDPFVIAASAAMLAAVALIASLLPAVRAARLEPMSALREE